MIITKEVEVKLGPSNIKYYRNIGYELPDKPSGKNIIVKVEDLSDSSWVEVSAKCDYCGFIKNIKFYQYKIIISKHNKFSCSNKCSVIKRSETQIKRYGVDNYTKSSEYKERVKKTNLERYGVENVFQSDVVKELIKKKNIERYGVDNISKLGSNYGNSIISNDINYIKYLDNSISLLECEFGHNYEISSDNYHSRKRFNTPLCTICNPIGEYKSIKEKELYDYLISIYNEEVIFLYKDKMEIDIYLPKLKLGFEFNGLYWHSEEYKDKNYHLNKTNYFKEKGIRVIHIWEDDWIYKQEIVKSMISNILKLNDEKIFARNCTVREIKDSKLTNKFLENNHIQGKVNSSLKLGVYHNDELVSLMTFDYFEGRNKMEEGGWNLNRFCNKLNTNVIGGASKLLSYFIKNYEVKRIISYADKDWSVGNLYYKLGFEMISESKPDYKYIVDKKRIHKSRYKKCKIDTKNMNLTETQIMKNKKIYKIYDCGKIKFVYKL